MKYYTRSIEPHLRKALGQFPVVLITGPRQAGKSTLLKNCLQDWLYVTLDDPALRHLAIQDPELFLSTHPTPLIIDEIQYAPHLLSYLKMRVDARRQEKGQYVLTGSQTFQLMEGISETLAGRVALFHLYPFSWSEICEIPQFKGEARDDLRLTQRMIHGFYPEFFTTPNLDWNFWFGSYVATYLERDLRNIKAITDLDRFQTFLNLLATRAGNLLNLSEIAKESGISQPTAKDWISILQATYVIYLLKPYYKNKNKRLIKTPKLYFIDTGLLCYLLGIDTPDRFLKASERGHIFENMVIMEQLKRSHSMKTPLFFYRTTSGVEIDLLLENADHLEAYEIKFSKTLYPRMATSLTTFLNEHPNATGKILSLREDPLPIAENITSIHWSLLSIVDSIKNWSDRP